MEGWESGLIELAPRVYAYIDPEGTWFKSNLGIVAGDNYTVLIDTQYNAERMRRILKSLREMGLPPVRLIVNTHHHGDHVWANHLLPDAVTISSRATQEVLKLLEKTSPNMYKPLFPSLDFTGAKNTPTQLAFEKGDVILEPPGAPKMVLRILGPAHTVGDLIVYLPDHDIVFAGDIVFYRVTPLAHEGYIEGWLKALDQLAELRPRLIVPGHGPLSTSEALHEVKSYFEVVRRAALRGLEKGLDPLEAALGTELGPYREWRDLERLVPNIERAYMELRGEPPAKPLPNIMETVKKMFKYRAALEAEK